MNSTLSVVVPIYNGAPFLTELCSRLSRVLEKLGDSYELILVNDGSQDGSREEILRLQTRFSYVRGIDLVRNYGQHNALLCGIRAAKNKVIITLDDDLQNPPEEIPKLLQKLSEGFDVVYGTPEKEQHNLWRDLASRITKLALQTAMGAETARSVSTFRVFYTDVREAFAHYKGPFPCIDVLLTWGAGRFGSVQVDHHPAPQGVSNYNFRKLVNHAMSMMTGFSTLPLELASMMGFLLTFFGFGVLVYVIGRYWIQGGSVPGFPFLASLIAIFSGAQLFALGIIGEYLARMHFRIMDRPSYVVRQETRLQKSAVG